MTIRFNLPLLAAALFILTAGVLAGLKRIGWTLGWPPPDILALHGPLLAVGFLGTLITLERAVALGKRRNFWWAAAFALGGLALLTGLPPLVGKLLFVLGGFGMVEIFEQILRRHRAMHTWVMGTGAVFLLAGSGLWASGWPVPIAVLWWAAFLVMTIAGERLELGRLLDLPSRAKRAFTLLGAAFVAGILLAMLFYDAGIRLMGAGMLGLAGWNLRYDLATRSVRKPGLTRFIAVCMLSGYVWLAVSGLLMLGYGAEAAGPLYDAQLHSLFLGFVFSMIFGHAPIIFPAIVGRAVTFSPAFYVHLALLHGSLVVRIIGDLVVSPELRLWGAMLNAVAILIFLAVTGLSIARGAWLARAAGG